MSMENLDTRFEILFRFMPMMDPQILHKTGHFTPILQECLTLPGSKEILASFGIDKLLAIRATTRISITGINCQAIKTTDDRQAEKRDRDQFAKLLLDLRPPPPKLADCLLQLRYFQQELFNGYLIKQIPDSYIQGSLPPMFSQFQTLSSTEEGRDAMRYSGFAPLLADIATLGCLLFLIAPGASSPAYSFSKQLLVSSLSILSNLMVGCPDTKTYISSSSALLSHLADVITQKIKPSEQEHQMLVLISTFVKNTYSPSAPMLSIPLAHALKEARSQTGRRNVKEALSFALWTASASPQVASSLSSDIGFIQSIVASLDAPSNDSEGLTGILANCVPQRHVDPGILEPCVQTLLKLTKGSDTTVRHCLRIFKVLVTSERGAEILIKDRRDLYLRQLLNHSNQQIVAEASDVYHKIESKRTPNDVGFQWNVLAKGMQHAPFTPQPMKTHQPQQHMHPVNPSSYYPDDHDRPYDFTQQEQGQKPSNFPSYQYTDLPKNPLYPRAAESDKADSPFDYAKINQDQPKVYNVENTPNHGTTSRSPKISRSPTFESHATPKDDKKMSGKSSTTQSGMASGYTSGMQSGARTPAYYQDTPLMFSRHSPASASSIESVEMPANASDSEPGSRLASGQVSPSDIPDSPGQHIEKINFERQQAALAESSKSQNAQAPFGKPLYAPEQSKPPLYANTASISHQPNSFPSHSQAPKPNTFPASTSQNMFPSSTHQQPNQPIPFGVSQPSQQPFYSTNMSYQQQNMSYQPFPSFSSTNYGGADLDDGPVAFNDEGSMSPRSKLSDLTIDSKSEISKGSAKSKEQPLREHDETLDGEKSFWDHHDNTVIDKEDGSGEENNEEDSFMNDLYSAGVPKKNKPKMKQPVKTRPSLDPKIDVIKYIDKKISEAPAALPEQSSSSETRPPVTDTPVLSYEAPPVYTNLPTSSGMSNPSPFMYAAVGSSCLDDAPRAFNTEGTPANLSARTSFSNITIESGLSGLNKDMSSMKISSNIMNSQTPPVKEEPSVSSGHFYQPEISSRPMNACIGMPVSDSAIDTMDQVKVFQMVEDTPNQGHSRTSSNTSLVDSNEEGSSIDLDELAELGMPKNSESRNNAISAIDPPYFDPPVQRSPMKPAPAFSTGSLPIVSPSKSKKPSKAASESGAMITPTRIPRGRRSGRRSSGSRSHRSGSDTREGYSRTPKSVRPMFPPEKRIQHPVHSTPHTPSDPQKSFSPKAKLKGWKDKILPKEKKSKNSESKSPNSDSAIL